MSMIAYVTFPLTDINCHPIVQTIQLNSTARLWGGSWLPDSFILLSSLDLSLCFNSSIVYIVKLKGLVNNNLVSEKIS